MTSVSMKTSSIALTAHGEKVCRKGKARHAVGPVAGLRKDDDRTNIIAYLATFADEGT